jgi:hypothetical protein
MAKAEARDRQMVEKQGKLLAKQTAKGRRRFEAETEARELKRRRERADKAKTKGKVREKQQEREAREERKRLDEQKSWKEADEKKWKRHLEGVAWGFDDRAGVRCGTSSEQPAGSYVRKGYEQHGEETEADHSEGDDEIAKRARRLRHDGSTWGSEAGGLGPEVVFEFGVPIPVKVPKRIGGWERKNNE